MNQEIKELRNQIILYDDIQTRLYNYIVNKKIEKLKINNKQYLNCLNFVYNKVTESTTPGNMKKNTPNKMKIEDKFFIIYKADLQKFCESLVQQLNKIRNSDAEYYLHQIDDQIKGYKLYMFEIFKIFRHLDSHYLKNAKKSLFLEGAKIFKEKYIEVIYNQMIVKIFEILTRFKNGQIINKEIITRIILHLGICGFAQTQNAIKLEKFDVLSDCEFRLQNLCPYQTSYFKDKFIYPATEYIQRQYRIKTQDLLKLSTPQYVNQALKLLAIEENVAKIFYDNDHPRKLTIKAAEKILANDCGRTIMENQKTGVYSMLELRKFDQLKKIYTLIKRSDHLGFLSGIFQRFIDKQGTVILDSITVQDEKNIKRQKIYDMISKLIELKDLADSIVTNSFESDIKLQQGRDNAFHLLVNKNQKVNNFLCYYADLELKKEKIQPQESANSITQILKIFRYIYSTDSFLKTYQKLLSMRILNQQFKNRDMEIQIINKLKSEAGAGALNKITTMINDINNSQKFYNDNVKNCELFKQIQFKIMILTLGSWPINDPKSGKSLVPPALYNIADNLQKVYQMKFPGKSLSWIFTYGGGLLSVKFKTNNNVHYLQVSNMQLLILLLFQDPNISELPVSEIYKKIKIEEVHINGTLIQLCRLKILIKTGEQTKVAVTDTIKFNENFQYKNRKINCVMVQKFVEKATVQLSQEIIKERELVIDSHIVKIMKARKIAKYEQVIPLAIGLTKTFKAEQNLIKRRVQALIQRQFIKRDEKQTNLLIYIP